MEENNPAQPPLTPPSQKSSTKLVVVLLTLIFFSPVGLILMWIFMKDWPTSAKRIVTLIYVGLLIIIVGIQLYLSFLVVSTDPFQKLKDAEKQNQSMLAPSPTPAWKTYKSKLGYTIAYPPEAKISSNDRVDLLIDLPSLQIQIFNYESSYNPIDPKNIRYFRGTPPTPENKLSQITINGISGYQADNLTDQFPSLASGFSMKDGDTTYLLAIIGGLIKTPTGYDIQNGKKLYNQILSTFKFTE